MPSDDVPVAQKAQPMTSPSTDVPEPGTPARQVTSPRRKRSLSGTGSQGDRFIPDRTLIDYATAFQLNGSNHAAGFQSPAASASNRTTPAAVTGHVEQDVMKEEASRLYTRVLRTELFGAAYSPPRASPMPNPLHLPSSPPPGSPVTARASIIPTARSALSSPTKLLQFRQAHAASPLRSCRKLDLMAALQDAGPHDSSESFTPLLPRQPVHDSPTALKFSTSPLQDHTLQVLKSPRKPPRAIPKTPFKILDAPDLADDFYMNLVDWGSSNLLSVGLGSQVYLWNACTSRVTRLCDVGPYDSVTSVNWIQRGHHLAVGTNRGLVQIWDAAHSRLVRTMTGHSARVGTLAWNDYILSTGSRDRLIYHRDVRSPDHHIRKLAGHKQEVCGLKWNWDTNQLASGGNDNRLLIWDRLLDQPTLRLAEHVAAVKAIAWSPHHHGLLASGGGTADRRIRFWSVQTGTQSQSIDTGSQVCNLAWSRTSNELVSTHGYSQNQINIWKCPSMQQLATLTGHTYRVIYLSTSPDAQTIVTGAGDETLRFWNVFSKSRTLQESSLLREPAAHTIR